MLESLCIATLKGKVPEDVLVYYMILVEMSDDFKQRLKEAYARDP